MFWIYLFLCFGLPTFWNVAHYMPFKDLEINPWFSLTLGLKKSVAWSFLGHKSRVVCIYLKLNRIQKHSRGKEQWMCTAAETVQKKKCFICLSLLMQPRCSLGSHSCHMNPRNDLTAVVGTTFPSSCELKDLFRIESEAQQHTRNILAFSYCYHSIALPFPHYKVWTRDFLIEKSNYVWK